MPQLADGAVLVCLVSNVPDTGDRGKTEYRDQNRGAQWAPDQGSPPRAGWSVAACIHQFQISMAPGRTQRRALSLLLLGRLQQDGVGRSAPHRHAAPGHADLDLLGWDEHGRTCINDEVLIADLITDTIQQFRQR